MCVARAERVSTLCRVVRRYAGWLVTLSLSTFWLCRARRRAAAERRLLVPDMKINLSSTASAHNMRPAVPQPQPVAPVQPAAQSQVPVPAAGALAGPAPMPASSLSAQGGPPTHGHDVARAGGGSSPPQALKLTRSSQDVVKALANVDDDGSVSLADPRSESVYDPGVWAGSTVVDAEGSASDDDGCVGAVVRVAALLRSSPKPVCLSGCSGGWGEALTVQEQERLTADFGTPAYGDSSVFAELSEGEGPWEDQAQMPVRMGNVPAPREYEHAASGRGGDGGGGRIHARGSQVRAPLARVG